MKTYNFLFYIIILIFFLFRCGFAHEEEITKNHYLIATDVGEQMNVSYYGDDDGTIYGTIIPAKVFSIGFNKNYIIAKQHPCEDYGCIDTITNYFILPVKDSMNWETKNGLLGPLNKPQFLQKRKELNIENLEFTKTFDSLK